MPQHLQGILNPMEHPTRRVFDLVILHSSTCLKWRASRLFIPNLLIWLVHPTKTTLTQNNFQHVIIIFSKYVSTVPFPSSFAHTHTPHTHTTHTTHTHNTHTTHTTHTQHTHDRLEVVKHTIFQVTWVDAWVQVVLPSHWCEPENFGKSSGPLKCMDLPEEWRISGMDSIILDIKRSWKIAK